MKFSTILTGIIFTTLVMVTACKVTKQAADITTSENPEVIAEGKTLFTSNCASCHNFNSDGIGPDLAGLMEEITANQIAQFIKNPKKVIESGDERAVALHTKYKSIMPSYFFLSDEKIGSLIAYINTQEAAQKEAETVVDDGYLEDPIPESIPLSDLVINVEEAFNFPPTGNESSKTRVTKLEPHPNTGDLYMLDLNGVLYRMEGTEPEVYMDMAAEMPDFIFEPGLASGFGSFAFHPDFENNGLLYTGHSEPAGTAKADFSYADSISVKLQWVISEWETNTPNAIPFKGSNRELFRIDMVTQIHGVQNFAFNPTAKQGSADYGNLYIGIGDGGASESGYPHLAVGPNTSWSSIFRIDPDGNNSMNGNYGIPSDNPFVDSKNEASVPEVYAHGFRNPHRFTWSAAGKMLSTNIGHHNIEALYVIEAGNNYGWPYREGSFEINPPDNMHYVYPLPADDAAFNVTYPALEYDHNEGNAISGGFVYNGNNIAELKGKYIFGDIVNGRLFYAEESDLKVGQKAEFKEWKVSLGNGALSFMELAEVDRANLRFGIDADGEIYLFSKNEGRVFRLVR